MRKITVSQYWTELGSILCGIIYSLVTTFILSNLVSRDYSSAVEIMDVLLFGNSIAFTPLFICYIYVKSIHANGIYVNRLYSCKRCGSDLKNRVYPACPNCNGPVFLPEIALLSTVYLIVVYALLCFVAVSVAQIYILDVFFYINCYFAIPVLSVAIARFKIIKQIFQKTL